MAEAGDLSNLRKEYLQSGITREDLHESPIEQFSVWFSQAMEANIIEPSAMSLATSDDYIGIRTVLLKYFDEKGFVFFTNYESKKSKQIQNNPQAAIQIPTIPKERHLNKKASANAYSGLCQGRRRIRKIMGPGEGGGLKHGVTS